MKKSLKCLLIIPILLSLTSCSISEAFSGVEEKIWPNIWITLAQFVSFVIMVLIVIFVAYKPVKKILDKRKNHISQTLHEAEENRNTANLLNIQAEQNLKDSHVEANRIILEAKENAIKEANLILEKNKQELARQKEAFLKQLQEERKNMEEEIYNEIVNGALLAAKEILKRELNNKDNDQIINEFIDSLNKEKNE